jgi:DNA-directed RNA polymerase beta subunit
MNVSSRLSHLSQINTPLNRDGKVPAPRQLHRSHFGILCAAETPEGKSVGLLKQLSLLARIRNGSPSHFIINLLYDVMNVIPVVECSASKLRNLTLVLVNGIICGGVKHPEVLVSTYREYRRCFSVPVDSSVTFKRSHHEVSILSDGGDCYRPLFCLSRMCKFAEVFNLYGEYLHLLWPQMLIEGVIEYINKEEESSLYIAMSYERYLSEPAEPFTHMELHSSFAMFGVSAGVIPFSNHNQAPRNIYQCLEVSEPVLFADGRRVAIGDVQVGDSVLTFNPVTLVVSATTVIDHMITVTSKRVVEVETVDGRCVVVTDDHLFMSSEGWVCASDFSPVTLLGVFEAGRVEFVEVLNVTESKYCKVADLTTLSSNHSFIGGRGNFLVHNSAMGKQAVAGQSLNFRNLMDTKTHVLSYPQRPPVTTWTSQLVGYDEDPAGQACVVAIMCFTGFNQEDSVILSQRAVDAGMFRSSFYRSVKESEVAHGADVESFGISDSEVLGKCKADYSKLGPLGIIPVASRVNQNTVLMGKTIEFTTMTKCKDTNEFISKRLKRDRSIVTKGDEFAMVDSVILSKTKDGLKHVSVKTCASRVPEVGDKFSSRHGQKGIVGAILPPEDMPFTVAGITPDIILNPHAIPSRMTIGQLLESALGKVSCMEGKIADGTPFRNVSIDEINSFTSDNYGKEVMFNGKTGELMKNRAFIGVTYYQRLRHMVRDKLHARSRGPSQILTRQPVEGRSRNGGFRVGEMERDALICYGASAVVTDRLMEQSDEFESFVCRTCGYMAEPAAPSNIDIVDILHLRPYCRHCDSNENISSVRIPYAFKLLTQEAAAVHVGMKFTLDD